MALNKDASTIYGGSAYEKFLTHFLEGNKLFERNLVKLVSFKDDVYEIPSMTFSDAIQDYSEMPTVSQGDFSTSSIKIEPKKFQIFTTYNPASFEHYWKHAQPTGKLMFQDLPEEVKGKMGELIINQVRNVSGKMLVSSDTAGATKPFNYFNGFEKIAKTSTATVKVKGGGITLDKTNIVQELEDIKAAIIANEKLRVAYDHPDFKFFMSYGNLNDYINSQRSDQRGAFYTDKGSVYFDGKEIIALNGVSDATIIGCVANSSEDSNLWVGMKNLEDIETITSARLRPEGDLYFFRMVASLGVQIARPETVVVYDAAAL